MYKLCFIALLTIISGCSSQVYRQAGSDKISVPFPEDKAIVLIDAKAEAHRLFGDTSGTMLVAFNQIDGKKSQRELVLSSEWEFATYPGAIIPGYSGEEPHDLQAYLLKPGRYVVVRCIYEAPEAEYCPAGYWTNNGKQVGVAYFEVNAGEVINTGQLKVIRTVKSLGGSTYNVNVINNQNDAKKYISNNWPSLADKLKYKPLKFAY